MLGHLLPAAATREDEETKDAEVEETPRSYAFEQVSDHQGEHHAYKPAVEFELRHESDIQAEPVGGYLVTTPYHLLTAQLRKRMHVVSRDVVKPVEERRPAVMTGDGTRPEVERMLGKVLEAGDRGIVERLKKQEAEIAAAACTQPEIGEMVAAYYVPLLLSALALDDGEFDAEYPGEGRIYSKQRAELAEVIQRHSQDCRRCSLKVKSDREWDEHVEKVSARDRYRFQIKV